MSAATTIALIKSPLLFIPHVSQLLVDATDVDFDFDDDTTMLCKRCDIDLGSSFLSLILYSVRLGNFSW